MYTQFMTQNNRLKIPITILLTLTCLTICHSGFTLESDRQQPIDIDAGSVNLDANTGFTLLTGDVAIDQGTLSIRSDEAEVYLEGRNPSRILLRGIPATWKQQLESGCWMDAEGKTIDYDVDDSIIVITGDAVVHHPQGTVAGDKLTYNLANEHFEGQSGDGGRVRMRLNPEAIDDIDEQNLGQPTNCPPVSAPANDDNADETDTDTTDSN